MNNLIVCPLHESRVDRQVRLDSFGGQPGRKTGSVPFGNTDIKESSGYFSENGTSPVPEAIAAVIATTRLSRSAISSMMRPNTSVYDGNSFPPADLIDLPVSGSNFDTP